MAGTSSIAGAIEALLYNDMSEKVYMYISAVVGFLTFILFIGYFPDFRKTALTNIWRQRAAIPGSSTFFSIPS